MGSGSLRPLPLVSHINTSPGRGQTALSKLLSRIARWNRAVCPGWSSWSMPLARRPLRTIESAPPDRTTIAAMRAFALVEIGDPNAIDVYLRRKDAFVALEEILGDEPGWMRVLSVVPIELDEREVSAN
jgi:hypothetical protein